jgi:hypothetical protein
VINPPGADGIALQLVHLDAESSPELLVYLADESFRDRIAIYRQVGTATPVYKLAVQLHSLFVEGTDTTDTLARQVGSGFPLLTSDDARFLHFVRGGEDYAALPLVLWSYSNGTLSDVSTHYPSLLGADAKKQLRDVRRAEKRRRDGSDSEHGPDPRGGLAAYAEDETRLGHRATAEKFLTEALRSVWLNEHGGPSGRGYISQLNRLLGTPDLQP